MIITVNVCLLLSMFCIVLMYYALFSVQYYFLSIEVCLSVCSILNSLSSLIIAMVFNVCNPVFHYVCSLCVHYVFIMIAV